MGEKIKKKQVMIVDDNLHVRNSLKSLFKLDNSIAICCEADNINDAIQLLSIHKPDIAIVDISFNGKLQGIEFIKLVREHHKNIKIIVLSMHDKDSLVKKALEAGADFFVSKEYAPEKIIEVLKSKREYNL